MKRMVTSCRAVRVTLLQLVLLLLLRPRSRVGDFLSVDTYVHVSRFHPLEWHSRGSGGCVSRKPCRSNHSTCARALAGTHANTRTPMHCLLSMTVVQVNGSSHTILTPYWTEELRGGASYVLHAVACSRRTGHLLVQVCSHRMSAITPIPLSVEVDLTIVVRVSTCWLCRAALTRGCVKFC